MARRAQRNRRRGPAKDSNQPATQQAPDRYDKFLPVWMKGANGTPVRPARPRRPRAARPAGGYTPGKLATGRGDL